MTEQPQTRAYQPQLDGVRALAVLTVVAFHARGRAFPGGYIGVDVFFVLSGFLITGLLVHEVRQTGTLSLRRFYVRRALRLLPALFLVCAVIGFIYLVTPGLEDRRSTLVGTLGALTYTSSPLAASGHNLGAMLPTWSLSDEEYFYIVWPVLLIAMYRWRRSWASTIVILTGIAVTYRFLANALFHWSPERLSYGADTRAEQLLIGASLAVLLPTFRHRIPTWVALIGVSLLGVYVLLPESVTAKFYLWSGSTLIALLAAIVIGHAGGRHTTWLGRCLSVRPLVWIGQRSYGIYLWNLPIVAIVALAPWSDNIQVGVKLALTFAIPALSYAYLERPFLRMKDRFEPGARPNVSSSSQPNALGTPAGETAEV